jgi:hypothetical protein
MTFYFLRWRTDVASGTNSSKQAAVRHGTTSCLTASCRRRTMLNSLSTIERIRTEAAMPSVVIRRVNEIDHGAPFAKSNRACYFKTYITCVESPKRHDVLRCCKLRYGAAGRILEAMMRQNRASSSYSSMDLFAEAEKATCGNQESSSWNQSSQGS